jgi:hypothetical protein
MPFADPRLSQANMCHLGKIHVPVRHTTIQEMTLLDMNFVPFQVLHFTVFPVHIRCAQSATKHVFELAVDKPNMQQAHVNPTCVSELAVDVQRTF